MSNEAAERLLDQMLNEYRLSNKDKRTLVEAVAAESRKATVERIRAAIEGLADHWAGGYEWEWDCQWRERTDKFPNCEIANPEHQDELISRQRVLAILDAEAER